MIRRPNIDKQIIASNVILPKDNFVAAAIKMNGGKAWHAGIIIKHDGISRLFHFNAVELDLSTFPIGKYYFHKDFIYKNASKTTAAFLAYCELIKENANPKYGYFYPGSFFEEDGTYFSDIKMPEYMTCVGFCLNVLKGFMKTDYIQYSDWTIADVDEDLEYLTNFVAELQEEYPEADVNKIIENVRRIRPDEYLASAFIKDYPVTKAAIDSIIDKVNKVLVEKI